MKSINKAILLGHVGRDPETRISQSGTHITSFSLATNSIRKDKNGAQEKLTTWHNCVAFGKLAEIIYQYSKKGSVVYVEGQIEHQQYEKDGVTRYATKVLVNDFSIIANGVTESTSEPVPSEVTHDDISDDIPF